MINVNVSLCQFINPIKKDVRTKLTMVFQEEKDAMIIKLKV